MNKVFILLLLTLTVLFTQDTNREPATLIDRSFAEEADYYLNKSREIALSLIENYPVDEHIIIGWGINSSPVINELRKELTSSTKSIIEVPVTRMSDIYKLAKSSEEQDYNKKLSDLTNNLFKKVLPSVQELGEKKIVFYRNLWTGNTFSEFSALLIKYLKENGYKKEVIFHLVMNNSYYLDTIKRKAKSNRSIYGSKPISLSDFKEEQDYIINSSLDSKYNKIIVNEINDPTYYKKNLTDTQRNTLRQKQVKLLKKMGILLEYQYFVPQNALDIIKNENWSGFIKSQNTPSLSLENRIDHFHVSLNNFLKITSTPNESSLFIDKYEKVGNYSNYDTEVYTRHLSNISQVNIKLSRTGANNLNAILNNEENSKIFFKKITFQSHMNLIQAFLNGRFQMQSIEYEEFIQSKIINHFKDRIKDKSPRYTFLLRETFSKSQHEDKYDFIIKNWGYFKAILNFDDRELFNFLKDQYHIDSSKNLRFNSFFKISADKYHDKKWLKKFNFIRFKTLVKESCKEAISFFN